MNKIKTIFVTVFLTVTATSFAQSESSFKLFEKSSARGGFGGFSVNYYNAERPFLMGEGAMLISNYYFGGYGYGFRLGTYQSSVDNLNYTVSTGSGGLLIGGFSNTSRVFALFAEMRIGFGGFDAATDPIYSTYKEFDTYAMTLIPGAGVVLRPFDFMQIRLQGGYSFSGAVELNGIDAPFNGGMFGVGLQFGGFN